jgi:excisionase family DNA binding protein
MAQVQEVVPLTLAAKRTALGEPAIRRMIHAGTIEARKLGRDWYLPVHEVSRLAREYPLEVANND